MEHTLLRLHYKNILQCKNLAAPDLSNSLKLLNAILRLCDKNKYTVCEILETFKKTNFIRDTTSGLSLGGPPFLKHFLY